MAPATRRTRPRASSLRTVSGTSREAASTPGARRRLAAACRPGARGPAFSPPPARAQPAPATGPLPADGAGELVPPGTDAPEEATWCTLDEHATSPASTKAATAAG